MYLRKHLQSLYLTPQVSNFLLSCPYFHLVLWITSARLLTRFDNKLAINIALSINCSLQDTFFVISLTLYQFMLHFCAIINNRYKKSINIMISTSRCIFNNISTYLCDASTILDIYQIVNSNKGDCGIILMLW